MEISIEKTELTMDLSVMEFLILCCAAKAIRAYVSASHLLIRYLEQEKNGSLDSHLFDKYATIH